MESTRSGSDLKKPPSCRQYFRILLVPLVWIVRITALLFTTTVNVTESMDETSTVAFLATAVMTIGA